MNKFLIIGGLVLIFLVGYWALNPSKNRLVRKARRLHKKGERYYHLGDTELADEYYAEAETVRKTARERS